MVEPKATAVRRVEVITGGVGRRHWTDDEKARVLEATLEPGAVVSEVARRHGLSPQQLFTWRRAARRKLAHEKDTTSPSFVPAVVDPALATTSSPDDVSNAAPAARPPVIELDIGGDSVWIWREADAAMVTAVIGALKAAR
jgi:transposase